MKAKLDIIKNFTGKKVLVVGDVMLDEYVFGRPDKVSQEAPVVVLTVKETEYRLGGAANAAHNIAALGGVCTLIGVVGDDESKNQLENKLKEKGIKFVLIKSSKPTTKKTRILGQSQQIVRIDIEDRKQITSDVEKKFVDAISSSGNFDIILVSDYAKGTLTSKVMSALKAKKSKIVIDPKPENSNLYSGCFAMTPNHKEADAMANVSTKSEEELNLLGKNLIKRFGANVMITRGKDGMSLFEQNGDVTHLPTQAREVYDVSGAGDTVAAAFALAVASGADLKEAAIISNHAAAIKVGKFGTAPVSQKELSEVFTQEHTKVKSWAQIEQISKDLKSQGKIVVFTNGCFDILHVGHTRLLQKAKSLGDVLILGLNTDESIRKLKGPGRPVINENERGEVLAALSCIDYIVFFGENEPSEIIKKVKPSIHVKGGDYKADDMPETKWVRKYGGKVVIIPLVEGKSTTNIIKKMK